MKKPNPVTNLKQGDSSHTAVATNRFTGAAWLSLLAAGMIGLAANSAYASSPSCDKQQGMSGKAGKYGSQRGASKGLNVERLARKLDLDASQKTQIQAVLTASEAQRQALAEKMKSNHQALKDASMSQPYDAAKVRTLADQQGDIKADMIVLRTSDRSQISSVLTEAQRSEFAQMGKRHRGKGRDKGHGRKGYDS